MSLYDIAMIIIFLGAIWFGYWKGLAWQIASVAAIFLSYFVAVTFPDAITPYISAEAPFNRFAAMLILFIGTSLIVWTIFASVSKSLKKMELKGFDRQAGALLGAFKGAVLCMVVTMFSVSLLGEKARDSIHQSKTGYYVVKGIDQLSGIAPAELAEFIHPHVETFQQNILGPDGSLPPKNPLFDRNNDPQQVNQSQTGIPGTGFPGGTFQNQQQPTQWQTPASQAGFQTPAQNPSQPQQQQWQGNYQSGTFGNSNNTQNTGGYQQGTFGGQGTQQNQWQQQPNTQQQYQNPNQTQWQPPAQTNPNAQQNGWGSQFPKISQGENGWPDVQFNVNSKQLLERGAGAALDAGKQWLENNGRQ